jgi:hypothetical protein
MDEARRKEFHRAMNLGSSYRAHFRTALLVVGRLLKENPDDEPLAAVRVRLEREIEEDQP